MSRRAWVYIWTMFLSGTALTAATLLVYRFDPAPMPLFISLLILTTIAQLAKVEAPSHTLYYATPLFRFAGLLVLPPFLIVILVVFPLIVEWIKERLFNSEHLRAWYLQPFNITMYVIAAITASQVFHALNRTQYDLHSTYAALAAVAAACVYVLVNHLILGLALVLARGLTWRESRSFDPQGLLSDMILPCLGYVIAILWALNPALILPALSPLALMYHALKVPQLKQEAQTDAKTGLLNPRHFNRCYAEELARAQRFNRPLALIMADLDLLRTINNTYGHLAGDVVISGIGKIIRAQVRDYDITGRFGGEEFAIVLPETSVGEAIAAAERIRRAIEEAPFNVSTHPTPIHATMSLGVACFPDDASTATELSHKADVAVYQAKLRGRNQVVYVADVPHSIELQKVMEDQGTSEQYAAALALSSAPTTSNTATPAKPDKPDPATEPVAVAPASANTPAPEPKVVAPQSNHTSNLELAGAVAAPAANAPTSPAGAAEETDLQRTVETRTKTSSRVLSIFVFAVIAAGVAVASIGWRLAPALALEMLLVLLALTLLAELFRVDLYEQGSISVSIALIFSAAMLGGLPAVAAISAACALGTALATWRNERRFSDLHKILFNWANHTLAGAVPALALHTLHLPLSVASTPLLLVPMGLAAIAYFSIETGLLAVAIGLTTGRLAREVWREQYRWLLSHYMFLSMMGMVLAIAYRAFGLGGVFVFVLPIFAMRYAQKQYMERTRTSIRELQRMNREIAQANRKIVTASQSIQKLNDELFETLARFFDARDPFGGSHAAAVARYAKAIAQELDLPNDQVRSIRQAGLLHDIGKIAIPECLLHKPDKLTDSEYEYIKRHATIGAELLEQTQALRHLATFVRYHHERWDGCGYPDGLSGDQIPLGSRILNLCDSVEAMASDRPYHEGLSLEEIITEVRRCSGTQFDPQVALAFLRIVEREGKTFVSNSAHEAVHRHEAPTTTFTKGANWIPLPNTALPSPSLMHSSEEGVG
ncbi:MAG: diguanylate cyclase [Chloroflexales bacterium]|nr:diguanylate cyclase [Chloroflexales bacterium]